MCTSMSENTYSFWLAAKEEVFDVKWVVNFSPILALALFNGRHSLFILGASSQNCFQLVRSGVDELLNSGTLAVS